MQNNRHAGLEPASIGPVSLWTPGQARGDEDVARGDDLVE